MVPPTPPETPALVVDLDVVTTKVAAIREAFGPVDIHYAVKANPMPVLLAHLRSLGVGFDVASPQEIDLVLAAGAAPDTVVYAHPVKAAAAIVHAADRHVARFAVDSVSEVRKIARVAPASSVFVRLSVPAIGAAIPLLHKFGCTPTEAVAVVAAALEAGLHVDGVSFHVGSQTTEPTAWEAAFAVVDEVLRAAQKTCGTQLHWVDIGGGLPAPHPGQDRLDLEDVAQVVAEGRASLPWPVQLACEPGRFLVAEAGTLHTSVIDVVVRGQDRWVFTDAGVYHGLFEGRADGRLQFPIAPHCQPRPGAWTPAVVTGPTCDSSDRLDDVYLLPPLAEGDRLVVGCAGAYPLTTGFNGFTDPTEWVSDTTGLRPGR
jgi:ornithine decarboxylase